MNYWQNRSFEITKEIFTDSESYVKFIHNEYEKAIAELDGRILNHLNAMSSEQGVSLAEANKLLSQAERMDLQEFINKAKGKITPDIEKSLNLASRRVRISRLQAMELEIKTSVSKLLNTEEKRLFAHLTNTFNKKYYNELYGLQRITGYENIFKINDDELRQIILNPWASDGSNFSNRIWKRRDKLVGTLRANLTRNIIAGRSNDDIIKNISSAMNVSKANAGRLVMTESAAMNSIATQKAYNRMKTEKYEILATLDLKTSDICQDMDSKVFDVKDYSVGITAPPFHPNCRTTTIPYFDDDLGLEDTRVARNIDTGKSEKVPDMSYKTWYDKYVVDKNANSGYNIRKLAEIEFDTTISGYKSISGGYNISSNGIKYGQETKIVAINKRNTTQWDELPSEMKSQLKGNKPFNLAKGEYEISRYVEGSIENVQRDAIAKELGAEYIGFAFERKNNIPIYIDFYQKGDELLYSIGKADVKNTITDSSLKTVEKIAMEREKLIMESMSDVNLKNIVKRQGDEWISAMKEFHSVIQADGKPLILSEEEYYAVKSPTLYRGIAPQSKLRKDIKVKPLSTKEMANEFYNAESPFPSRGVFGDGIAYSSPSYGEIALKYATDFGTQKSGGIVIEFKLKEDAKIIDYEDALGVFQKISAKGDSKLLFYKEQVHAKDTEVGKAMNALGYDAIIKRNGDGTGQDFYVILNRGALVTKKKYITTEL